jgi:class 3 adenylate cyclase
MHALKRLIRLGIDTGIPETEARYYQVGTAGVLIAYLGLVPFLITAVAHSVWPWAVACVVYALVLTGSLVARWRGAHRLATDWAFAAWIVWFVVATLMLSAGNHDWLLLIPVAAPLLFGAGRGRAMFLALGVSLVAFAVLEVGAFEPAVELDPDLLLEQRRANPIILFVVLAIGGVYSRRVVLDTEAALNVERQRSESLLLNVLPETIAARLKDGPGVIADSHDEVTVLFADIVGFTPLSERVSAEETVEILNEIFSAFDQICDEHGVEKLRTIGDGYMVAAGIPIERPDHAEVMTEVALAIRAYIASRSDGLQVRIGLNTGPAVAGIVGRTRFHYDVWGDAVNVAARMESTGEPGRIQIAEGTFERIRDAYACEPRGNIDVKGKGTLRTWFVEGRRTAA